MTHSIALVTQFNIVRPTFGTISELKKDEKIYVGEKPRNILTPSLTVEASMLPPNQTAYRCIWWEITCTSIGFG